MNQKEKREETKSLHELFRKIWLEREDEHGYCHCFASGRPMYGRTYWENTCCYHHVLEKRNYPEYKFLRKNIVIVHPDIHTLVENNIDRVPKIRKYREYLLSLHTENKLIDD